MNIGKGDNIIKIENDERSKNIGKEQKRESAKKWLARLATYQKFKLKRIKNESKRDYYTY
ncbi:MAG: hypothetical protein R3331_05390 [Sulfurospirillaceae bacterium]|nr:hypothetical protein [Sulfurospirillaceae bacterium]